MKREQRYGIKSLEKDFPTDEDCLEFIFDAQHSRKCSFRMCHKCHGRHDNNSNK